MEEVDRVSAHNYHPIPIVIAKSEGVWVWDVEGRKCIDMLSAYSALNQGHRHPKVIAAAKKQLDVLTLTARAFHNDQMGPFLAKMTKLTGYDKMLPMNTGAEAVETAIKAARRWGYKSKKVPENSAEIIVCSENFHGRTTTIVGFSTDPSSYEGFGPFTPGFKVVKYGDAKELEAAVTRNTVAFLVEPIQGEAGVIVPPAGYLKACEDICKKHDILFMADEIQTGLGRTGKFFCHHHDNVRPDVVIVGKALGGGVYPVSGILADDRVMMAAFEWGNHGSTFGGNPLACAIASAAIDVILDEKLSERSLEMGEYFMGRLRGIKSQHIMDVRGRGLLIAVQIKNESGKARKFTEALMREGVLAKETHDTTIRFAPPLTITKDEIDWAVERIAKVLA